VQRAAAVIQEKLNAEKGKLIGFTTVHAKSLGPVRMEVRYSETETGAEVFCFL
jgi:hypothetical protein